MFHIRKCLSPFGLVITDVHTVFLKLDYRGNNGASFKALGDVAEKGLNFNRAKFLENWLMFNNFPDRCKT